MRQLVCVFCFLLTSLGSVSHASGRLDIEKVKTGILPSGGLYSLYAVVCSDQGSGSIVQLKDENRWCTLLEGTMRCHTWLRDASLSACMSGALAVAEDKVEKTLNYQ